jgi:hypothetical protein
VIGSGIQTPVLDLAESAAGVNSTIIKSGAVSGDEPDAAFKSLFLNDRVVRLPVGTWDITAQAGFVDGANCEGQGHTIKATVRVHVTE